MRAGNFVEETTTSIAGTNGDGAVTMTAITSVPRFSTVLGTQATTVRYTIEDTVTKSWETGIGSVASNVLTRTRPQITWNGTTYDDSTPSPIAFGSTPTSGNVRIRMAATAESQGLVVSGVNNTFSGDAWRDYPITNSVGWANGGSAATLTANTEYYTCHYNLTAGLLTGIQFDVTTALTGGMKLALYAVGSNGLPGQRIVTFNTASVSTTGIKTDTTTGTWSPSGPVWLVPGYYYIGFISDVACAIRGFTSSGEFSIKARTPLGRLDGYGWSNTASVAGSYASGLPASPAPTAIVGTLSALSVPWIGLRVVP